MQIARWLQLRCLPILTLGFVLAVSLSSPTQLHAQKGYNAVCTSSTPPTNAACSLSALDASQYTGSTICQQIYSALSYLSTLHSPNPNPGAVVDARSITSGLTCSAANETPWTSGSSVVTTPAIILLPAGLITISTGWIIPDRTRVFGEGERSNPGAAHGPGTQIVAASGFTGTMISLGGANLYPNSSTVYPCGGLSGICFGVSISDVMINGNFQNVVGIANTSSQELSYANNINLYGILGTGLSVTTTQAQNSGPYSNLVCNPGPSGSGFTSTTTCVDINNTGDLRGIHGLTATVGSDSVCPGSTCPTAAIYLDSSSTTIEDAHFEGFANGILVGSVATAKGDVIFNVSGGGSTLTGPTTNVIEIGSNTSDLSIMGVTAGTNPTSPNPNSIYDTLNSPTLTLTDAHVALYAIGEPVGSYGYSRFTTSATGVVPTWGGGGGAPSGSCKVGSLYSNTAGASSSSTLYLCALVSGSPAWVAH